MKIVNCKEPYGESACGRQMKILSKGITLIEIVVVIFVITLFSMILISDFPKIQRQFALSRATYKLAQDLKKTQDLGLSGVSIKDKNENPIAVKGYGIYISNPPTTQYVIYADIATTTYPNGSRNFDKTDAEKCDIYNSSPGEDTGDCIIEIIDISKENSSLYIESINKIKIGADYTSINFSPPDPITKIDNIDTNPESQIGIVLGNGLTTRTVFVNISGLINVQ